MVWNSAGIVYVPGKHRKRGVTAVFVYNENARAVLNILQRVILNNFTVVVVSSKALLL